MGPKPRKTATHVNYASIPGRSRLGLNSRQVQAGPQFIAPPSCVSFPSCGVCGLRGFTPSPLHPGVAGCGASPLHPFTRGLRGFTPSPLHPGVAGFTPSPLHPGFAGCGASPLHPGFAGCGASPLHLGLGASRTQISESGSGIGGGHSGHVAAV